MNWTGIWQYVVGGIIVTWPGMIAGFIISWRKTRAHVDERTCEQNELIEKITHEQTRKLLSARSHPAGQAYHGHEGENP